MFRLSLACVVSLLLGIQVSQAAPPKVDHLFPAGGQRGKTVDVTLAGSLGSGTVQIWCSRKEVGLTVDTKTKKLTVTIPADAVPGVCWIRFYNAEGASALKPFLIGMLEEQNEKEPNNRLSEAEKLKTSTILVNGVLSKSNEVDTYAVELKKGQTLVASMTANRQLGSPMDGVLQIVSPQGFVLEQNDDELGFDPQLVFTPAADGLYYIRTFAFPTAPNSSIRFAGAASYIYRLTLTTGPYADHAWPSAVAQKAGDQNKGQGVRLYGWNLPDNLSGLVISDDVNSNSAIVHHNRLANALSLERSTVPVAVEQEAVSQAVSLPVAITGRIDQPNDADSYSFSSKKGEKLLFRAEARRMQSPLDPVLRIYDASGKLLKEQDTRSKGVFDEVMAYTIPADGTYRLDLTDLYSHGGLRYVYRLTIEPQLPDYSLSLAGDVFQVTPGKPLEIPVTVSRKYGMNDEIEISLAVLPPGVQVKPVISQKKGATAKSIKLIVKATATATFNGQVQVVGRSTGKAELKRTAEAPIAGLTDKIRTQWLTVLPSKPVEAKKP